MSWRKKQAAAQKGELSILPVGIKGSRIEKAAIEAIRSGDLHAYVRTLHDPGMKDGTPEYENALKIFHSFVGRR